MDEFIKEYLRTSPGLSAEKVADFYRNKANCSTATVYRHLRKLKQKGVLINKSGRWYVNSKKPRKDLKGV